MSKNQEVADEMLANDAAIRINDKLELFGTLKILLTDREKTNRLAKNAQEYVKNGHEVLDVVSKKITALTNIWPKSARKWEHLITGKIII